MHTSSTSTAKVAGNEDAHVFVPLDIEVRAAVPTLDAAFHLSRAQQTLRIWACRENGPLRPMRINGRLAWPVADLRRLLGVA